MALVLKPLENAWGCYKSGDLSGLKYGTCPEFKNFEITGGENNRGQICSRPESTVNCVTRPGAFTNEHTASSL